MILGQMEVAKYKFLSNLQVWKHVAYIIFCWPILKSWFF